MSHFTDAHRQAQGFSSLEFCYLLTQELKGHAVYLAAQNRAHGGLYWTTDPFDAIRFVSSRTARGFAEDNLTAGEQEGVSYRKYTFGDETLLEKRR